MHSFLGAVGANETYLLLGVLALCLILLVYCISLSRRISMMARKQRARAGDGSVGDITAWLNEHSEAIDTLRSDVENLSSEHKEQMKSLANCIQKFGMVRFNAFDDIGGEQSFAMVLLDAEDCGVAISSLYGRHDARLYAKGIVNGQGERPLSEEEQRALGLAREGRGFAGNVRTVAGR